MDMREKLTPEVKKRIGLMVGAVVVLLLVFFIFVRPSIIGYATYQDLKGTNYSIETYGADLHELRTALTYCETNLSAHIDVTGSLLAQLDARGNNFSSCVVELGALKANHTLEEKEFDDRAKELQAMIDERDAELATLRNASARETLDLQDDFDDFVALAARSKCCRDRVDDANIDSYDVVGNKVVCSAHGSLNLSC